VSVTEDTAADAKDGRPVPLHEQGERCFLSLATKAFQQLGVIQIPCGIR
jgi:hypothetical protein